MKKLVAISCLFIGSIPLLSIAGSECSKLAGSYSCEGGKWSSKITYNKSKNTLTEVITYDDGSKSKPMKFNLNGETVPSIIPENDFQNEIEREITASCIKGKVKVLQVDSSISYIGSELVTTYDYTMSINKKGNYITEGTETIEPDYEEEGPGKYTQKCTKK